MKFLFTGGYTTVLLAIFLLSGCSGQPRSAPNGQAQAAAPQKIEVAAVIKATLPQSIEIPASVEPYERVNIMSRLEGHVQTIHVDIGKIVKQGDLLATLNIQELHDETESCRQQQKQAEATVRSQQAEVDVAKAGVAQAQAEKQQHLALMKLRSQELTRITGLVENGALGREKMEEAQFALQAVQAQLDKSAADISAAEKGVARSLAALEASRTAVLVAAARLKKSITLASYTKITAPFDGLITERMANTGSLVLPASDPTATALFEIVTHQRMRIVCFLPMKEAGLVDTGDAAQVSRLQGLPNVSLAAAVSRHARAFHRGARMMRVEIDLTNPIQIDDREVSLKPGDYGFAVIDLHQHEQVATIPRSALSVEQSKDGKSYVIVVDDGNKCSKQEVQILVSYENPGGTPVVGVTGLTEGQTVITAGVTSFMGLAAKNQSLPGNAVLVEQKTIVTNP